MDEEEIHVNENVRVAWGKARPGALEMWRVVGKSLYEVVIANREDREKKQRSGAQVNYI